VRIEFADLGLAGVVIAEYDPVDDAVRIDRRAYECVRFRLGADEASRFARYALAHEFFHRAHPAATEAQAHAHAHAIGGIDAATFERAVRP
jgi:hypothetical protein